MRRIYRSICSRRLINAITGTGKSLSYKNARALAIILVIALLVTSLPASARTNSHKYTAIRDQRSFVSQLYSDLGTALASIGTWVRGVVRPKPAVSRPSEPVVAYLNPAPPFISEPTNLSVTSASSTLISLSWTPPAGGADHYQIERSESISGPFSFIGNAGGATINDGSVTNLHAYLYRVRAVSAAGAISMPSNMALGTAISFEFQELDNQAIKAQHFYDVRTAINKVRALAGMPDYSWARGNLANLEIKADDVTEMRTALNAALNTLFIPLTPYEDPSLTINLTQMTATHLEQLQVRSTRGASTSSGPMDSDSSSASLEPLNATGGGGENPLSRNFNWMLPVVNLPGRAGMDLSLSLSYNSLVWTKSGNSIIFDRDHGSPSPGFRLGFPVIQPLYYNSEVGKNAFLLVSSDGSRTELRQVGTSALYEAADSSHVLLDTGSLASTGVMTLTTTDGTRMKYSFVSDGYQCTEIKDRNGNYITVNYTNFGRIDTVIDTANRTIKFNYSTPDNLLTSITQAWAGQQEPHIWATFAYEDKQLNTNFNGLTLVGVANNQWLKVLRSVTLEDNSRYEFDHSNWIQVWKIKALGIDGHVLNYHSYNLPTTNTLQNDCPRFTERRDWVENWNRTGANGPAGVPNGAEAEVVTQSWNIPASGSWTLPDGTQQTGMVAQVTQPDGTYDKIYYEGVAASTTGWRRGLIAMIETYGSSNPAQSAPIIKQRSSVRTWKQDLLEVSYPLNPRVEETRVYDFNSSGQIQNRSRTTIAYETIPIGDGTSCKLPNSVTEYRADATIPLRRTSTTYLNDASYLSRRIVGLATFTNQYQVNPSTMAETLVSKTGVTYDDPGSTSAPQTAPVQHDNTAITARGNASTIKRYDTNSSAFLTSTIYYDTAGSVVKTVDPAGHQVQIIYEDQFYADGVTADATRAFAVLAYPTTVTDADNFTTKTRFNYDLGAPMWVQLPQPNGTSNDGPQQKFTYDSARRLQRVTNLVNSSYTRYVYGPNYTEVFASINTVSDELHAISVFDGAGRTIASAQNDPDPNSSGFNASLILVDQMGRMSKQSMPVETSVSVSGSPINPYSWSALGADATANNGFGWLYTSRTFDWKGRPLLTTNTDGTTTTVDYEGCGCAGGEVATFTDEGTLVSNVNKRRQQKTYTDSVGRTVKTEIWDFDGTGAGGTGRQLYATRVTTYNALNQPQMIRDFKGVAPANLDDLSCPSGDCQHTDYTYDGYGRLHTRHFPSQQATTGPTSDHTTWEYNLDDTIHSVTDARGVVTTFAYNNRHLPTNISYDLTGTSGVAATPDVSYAYDAAGNRTSMTDAAGHVLYHYDSLSRMDWEERTFANRLADGPYRLSYQYNLAGLVTRVFDEHAQKGFRQTYDAVARLTGASGLRQTAETTFASQIKFRASGALRSMTLGGATVSATYNQRGLLASYSATGLAREYQYYNDGRLKFAEDNLPGAQPTLNRAFSYDLMGRIKEAFSGSEALNYANNTAGGAQDGPYRHAYSYDVWNNQLGVDSRLWTRNSTITLAAFSNNRQPAWTYDNDGNVKTRNEPMDSGMALPYLPLTYKYDGAGRQVLITQTRSYPVQGSGPIRNQFYNTAVFDDSGNLINYVNTRDVFSFDDTLINSYVDSGYFLRSTVLGGRVVSEYADNGWLLHNYVYAGTERIGDNTQFLSGDPVNYWFHEDPVTGDTMKADASGSFGRTIVDPQGLEVGDTDPFPTDGSGDPDGIPDVSSLMNPGLLPIPFGGVRCVLDGIDDFCMFSSSETSSRCPNNDCRPKWNPTVNHGDGLHGSWEFFHSFQNGYSGYMTEYGYRHYDGGSSYFRSAQEAYEGVVSYLGRTAPVSGIGGLGLGVGTDLFIQQKANLYNSDEFTPEQEAEFTRCLSEMFKVYNDGHKYQRGGEAYFNGHSDSVRHYAWPFFSIGGFTVTTDQQSYSNDDLKNKDGKFGREKYNQGLVVGFTDPKNPYVNAIANDAAIQVKGREFLGLWVYELGNALAHITNRFPATPPDSLARYGRKDEPGSAFEDCVFGGRLNADNSVQRPGQ